MKTRRATWAESANNLIDDLLWGIGGISFGERLRLRLPEPLTKSRTLPESQGVIRRVGSLRQVFLQANDDLAVITLTWLAMGQDLHEPRDGEDHGGLSFETGPSMPSKRSLPSR